jgi:hypothetical protein
MNEPHVHPNVVEYLRTFVPTPDLESRAGPSSTQQFPDAMYSMPSMTGSFTSDPNLFQQQQQQYYSHSPSSQTQSMDTGSFPQYFPVYDYGSSDGNHANSLMQMDVTMNGQMMQATHGRNSLTPEANMQTTWNEFVTGLGMAS